MIIPAGKSKHQVNQGGLKHESMLDSSLFAEVMGKTALATGTITDDTHAPQVPDKLQDTMNQGGLDPERGMPEGADMRTQTSMNPEESMNNMDVGTPQTQTGNMGGDLEGQLAAQFGQVPAAIISDFISKLKGNGMLAGNYAPDALKTQFTIGGGGVELKVPSQQLGGKIVDKI